MLKLDFTEAEKVRQSLTEQQQKDIEKLYEHVSKQIAKEAKKAPRVPSDSLRKLYLNGLKKQVDGALNEMRGELQQVVESNMLKVAEAVVTDNQKFLQKVGLPIEGSFSHVSSSTVMSVASGKLYDGDWHLSRQIWKHSVSTQKQVNSIVAEGIAQNKSAYDIALDLQKFVDPKAAKDWEWSKVYPNTAKKIDYNAQRLARTMVSHAYQQAFVRTTQNNPFVTKYRWEAANSTRVCPICAERDGQFFEKDKLPLDHPNGMCTFTAVMEQSSTEIANRLADWAQGKEDSELNKYAESLYGNGWEKKKDAVSSSETTNKGGTDWSQIPTTLTQESKDLLKRYTNGWYDIPNEMAKMVRNGGTLESFAKTRVSPTGYTQEQAEARFRTPFEAVQNILNTIAHSKEFDILTRIETHDSVPALESVLSWGLRSTSQAKNFEDKALLGKIRGMEFLGDSSMPTLVYKIQNAPGLDISKYSPYKAQKEVLVSGDFRVVKIDEQEQIGSHKSITVWLEYLNR